MKRHLFPFFINTLVILVLTGLVSGCSKDEDTQTPQASSICFTVSGFTVTVRNLWTSGASYSTNVQGVSSFSETVSQNNESHSLVWTNIQNNYSTYTVDSFNVKIDGKDYSYPAQKCK